MDKGQSFLTQAWGCTDKTELKKVRCLAVNKDANHFLVCAMGRDFLLRAQTQCATSDTFLG